MNTSNLTKATLRFSLLVIGLTLFAPCPRSLAGDVGVVAIAKSVADNKYKSCTYGDSDLDPTKVNCVQYLISVIQEVANASMKGSEITREVRKRIAVNTLLPGDDLQKLVESEDDRIKGVQWALIEADLGVSVQPADARAGDFIQYWYQSKGKWYGHSGVIEKIEGKLATIYGSHKSTLQSDRGKQEKKGGIGSGPVFDLTNPVRKVFVVRWKPD